jgi:hypothetical protein
MPINKSELPITYDCKLGQIDTLSYTDSITCPDEYKIIQGPPLLQSMGQVASVKIVYEITTKRIYFVSSKKFSMHYDFCKAILAYPYDHTMFNNEQYFKTDNRLYYLASINHYTASDIYTIEFFADDKVTAEGIDSTFSTVKRHVFFSDKLYFLPTSTAQTERIQSIKHRIRIISHDEVYRGQVYQGLNCAESYGYLRMVDINDIETTYLGRHDIVLLNGIPNDISAVSGIITSVFQTPLSHINVLSHNRGTPNMAHKKASELPSVTANIGELVHFKVTPDSFTIRRADIGDAEKFWKITEPTDSTVLVCDDSTEGLFAISMIDHSYTKLVGAKAANFGELTHVDTSSAGLIPIPEGAFAIPFFYYRNFIKSNGLDTVLNNMLTDSLFNASLSKRDELLAIFRKKITDSPIDPQFIALVESKIKTLSNFKKIRFRSSTNAEDIAGFNGAGLYESYSADLDNKNKSIGKAIKQVYASMWTRAGFEERSFFRINQKSAAMGILVHRSFDEEANGVCITKNIYNKNLPAITINAQTGETSVVSPPAGVLAEQLLFYTLDENSFVKPAIQYISHSSLTSGKPVLTENELIHLSRLCSTIKLHFYLNVIRNFDIAYDDFAMDIEFKIDGPDRKIYIKQARPF